MEDIYTRILQSYLTLEIQHLHLGVLGWNFTIVILFVYTDLLVEIPRQREFLFFILLRWLSERSLIFVRAEFLLDNMLLRIWSWIKGILVYFGRQCSLSRFGTGPLEIAVHCCNLIIKFWIDNFIFHLKEGFQKIV